MTDLLFQLGTYHRRPDGFGNTLVAEQKAAGVTWGALNIGGDVNRDPTVWDAQRDLYRKAGIACGPWMHVRSMADLDFLVQTAHSWDAELVGPNIEDVVKDKLSLMEVGAYLQKFWVQPTGKPVHMATLPWVQNGQGWQSMAFAYFALELFPLEAPLYVKEWEACIDHAFREGAKLVTLLYSTTSPRSTYPAAVAHCLYTADNVTSWPDWKDTLPQLPPKPPDSLPPPPPEVPQMLSPTRFPYTGPLYGPSHAEPATKNRATVKGLKRAMMRLDYLKGTLGSETDDFGPELEAAFKVWMKEEHGAKWTHYGVGSWNGLRAAKLTAGPNKGQYAMDAKALAYVREDALAQCYPHPAGVPGTYVGQGLHETGGVPGNWGVDFMAPGGTKVLAVEAAIITRLSGHAPSSGVYPGAVFGWSISYETSGGYRYFSTHYGSRKVVLGQQVDCGEVIGAVGNWPNDPGRSHTHLGCSSSLGQAAAKKRILEITQAKRVTA